MARFSKTKMVGDLYKRAEELQVLWRFDRNNGTAQLKPGDIDRAVAYGEWKTMRNLSESINFGGIGA